LTLLSSLLLLSAVDLRLPRGGREKEPKDTVVWVSMIDGRRRGASGWPPNKS